MITKLPPIDSFEKMTIGELTEWKLLLERMEELIKRLIRKKIEARL